MPEGDTLFRTAYTLRLALKGRRICAFHSPLAGLQKPNFVGKTVAEVESRGKNLLIFLDDGCALYSHLRMEGSWHIYQPEVPWQKPARLAKAVIETDAYVAVCFNAPSVEYLTPAALKRHPVLSKLGQDLLSESFDIEKALEGLRQVNALPIGEAIMRQQVMAGIGNVYKSEVLFLCQADPFLPVAAYDDIFLKRLIAEARRLMHANVKGRRRTTRHALDGGRLWVYERSGRPCRRCGATIKMRRQGMAGRSTYWCPQCQRHEIK